MSDLKLYDLAPSPNNIKVHIALTYKDLAHERIPVDPQDRAAVVEVSGQPLTPVLVHGDRVVFDSAAILRYLDANFRDTPRLFAEDAAEMHEIERWEQFGRGELVRPVGIVFGQAFAKDKNEAELREASQMLHELTGRIEKRLEASDWLVGEGMTAADVTAAPVVYLGMLPEAAAEASNIHKFFAANLGLGDGRDRTRAWAERVMAYNK